MTRLAVICLIAICAAGIARAQAPPPPPPPALGDSAKKLIGSWEFSNADRDKICAMVFKSDRTAVGFKVEFDKSCADLFPLLGDVAGWTYPDNDLLNLLDARGKALVEFSEVEAGIFEAPTPGVGVLFLQNPAAAGPPPKRPAQVAGNWTLMGAGGETLCAFALASTPVKDGLALTAQPDCDAGITKLNFVQWRMDRGELVLVPRTGAPWRFEVIDDKTWGRLPETTDRIKLVRQ